MRNIKGNLKRIAKSFVTFSLAVTLLASTTTSALAETFGNVRYLGGAAGASNKAKGVITVSEGSFIFQENNGGSLIIPMENITQANSGQAARRRILEGVIGVALVGVFAAPLFFLKSRQDLLTIEYNDPRTGRVRGAAFALPKGKAMTIQNLIEDYQANLPQMLKSRSERAHALRMQRLNEAKLGRLYRDKEIEHAQAVHQQSEYEQAGLENAFSNKAMADEEQFDELRQANKSNGRSKVRPASYRR